MGFPAFFDQALVLVLRDALSELLGATPDGLIEYRYADAVRLAGHSCPTVAGAFLCARAGLRELYGQAVPERGGVEVSLPDAEDAGVAGVIGQVLTLVTGAAGAESRCERRRTAASTEGFMPPSCPPPSTWGVSRAGSPHGAPGARPGATQP